MWSQLGDSLSSLRVLGLSLEHSAAGQAGLSTKLVHLVQAGDLSVGELSGLQSWEGVRV